MKRKIGNVTLLTHDQSYMRFMMYSIRQERVRRSQMPYKARLAAMQAVSQTTVTTKVW